MAAAAKAGHANTEPRATERREPRYSTFVHGAAPLGVAVASAQTPDEFGFLERSARARAS